MQFVDLLGSNACAVCDGRISLETFLGDEACFFGWYVGEQGDYVKIDKKVRLTEGEVLDDVDELT